MSSDSVPQANVIDQSLFGPGLSVMPGKLISLSKSKEYTKLASQVPSVYSIKDGKPILGPFEHSSKADLVNSTQFLGSGGLLSMGHTSHEKYLKSLE